MPIPLTSAPDNDLASQILVLVGQDPGGFPPSSATGQVFARATRKQLLDCAKRLGLQGVSALTKEELAGRVQVAFEDIRSVTVPTNGGGPQAHKFDLGPAAETEPMPQDIPWGYSQDRVTAMVVDPDRLYVYWEVTNDAITAARAGLGPAGKDSWLSVRVYDITGRLFDGTNAHSYFDHRIERHDRQWFFAINKPTSTACVEVGLMSPEGYFVKTARSGRVEFPRRDMVGDGPLEWLSVRTATGWAGSPFTGSAPPAGAAAGGGGAGGGGGEAGAGGGGGEAGPAGWEDWTPQAGFPVPGGQRILGRRWEVQEGGVTWTSELNKSEWMGPLLRTEWEAGPFIYPMEVPSAVEFRDSGEIAVRTEGGRVHVTYGPWQVVIRGLGARAERRVLGTWEYRRQVALTGGVERVGTETRYVAPGSSEWLLSGASERMWQGSSELLFRGASELWLIGASEILLRGASETMYQGASELRFRGASERLLRGASERLARGASEWAYAGASERMYQGASERAYAGASERMLGGASEQHQSPSAGSFSPYPGPAPEKK